MVCYLAGGDEIVILIKKYEILHLDCRAIQEENTQLYSPQHGDEDGYTLSLCCKFEINLKLFAIWLVVIK